MRLSPGVGVALLILVALAFDALCLVDLARAYAVRNLDKFAWAVIICVSTPLGGMAYIYFGRVP